MAPSNTLDEKKTSEMQGSEVQGSGKTIFHLLKIIVDVIDDELQVSDAHKCAGKKVDNGKRVMRVAASASSKVLNVSGQRRLGRIVCPCPGWCCGGEG